MAIDQKTGTTVWTKAIRGVQSSGDYAIAWIHASPAAGDGKVFVLGYDFVLRAHDAKTGKVLWQTKQPDDYAENLQIMLKSGAIGIRTLNSKGQPTTKTSATALFAPPVRYADGVVLYSLDPARSLLSMAKRVRNCGRPKAVLRRVQRSPSGAVAKTKALALLPAAGGHDLLLRGSQWEEALGATRKRRDVSSHRCR